MPGVTASPNLFRSSRPRVDDDAEALADGLQTEAYCSNSACRNSEIAAQELSSLGYRNVRKYAEGKQDWTEAGLELESGALAA